MAVQLCSNTQTNIYGILAQLVEQGIEDPRVSGSSPLSPTIFAEVAQLVRAPPCQGGGCDFESHFLLKIKLAAEVAQMEEHRLSNPMVVGSSPAFRTKTYLGV